MSLHRHTAMSSRARALSLHEMALFMQRRVCQSHSDVSEMTRRLRALVGHCAPGEAEVLHREGTPEIMDCNHDRIAGDMGVINSAVLGFQREGWTVQYVEDVADHIRHIRFVIFTAPSRA